MIPWHAVGVDTSPLIVDSRSFVIFRIPDRGVGPGVVTPISSLCAVSFRDEFKRLVVEEVERLSLGSLTYDDYTMILGDYPLHRVHDLARRILDTGCVNCRNGYWGHFRHAPNYGRRALCPCMYCKEFPDRHAAGCCLLSPKRYRTLHYPGANTFTPGLGATGSEATLEALFTLNEFVQQKLSTWNADLQKFCDGG
jgi:hypothetical protein